MENHDSLNEKSVENENLVPANDTEAIPEENVTPIQSEESAPEEEATPAEEVAPAEEAAPVEETAPAEEVAPVEDAAPAEEPTPIEETAPTEESVPTEESAPTEVTPTAEMPKAPSFIDGIKAKIATFLASKFAKPVIISAACVLVATIAIIIGVALGASKDCSHEWADATCTSPKTCSLCEATEGSAKGHTPGAAATCTTAQTCTVCNAELVAALGHQYESAWSYDDAGHYHASACGHTDAKDYTAHNYESVVTDPTCTDQGYTTYTCVCGKTYKDDYTSAADHSYETALSYDAGGHWYESTCEHNVTKGYATHSYSSVVTPPTCTEQGYTTYTCECGYSYISDYVSENGHNVTTWTEVGATLYDAQTCKYVVSYTGDCSVCNQPQQKDEYVERHAWTYVVKTVATCQVDGVKEQYCKNDGCNYKATPKGEAPYSDPTAHNWSEDAVQGDMISYRCDVPGCNASKNTVYSNGTSANVSSGNVGSLDEVNLNNTVIGFDQGIKDKLVNSGSNVEISADTLKDNDRNTAINSLTPEQKALLGDKDIYNFTVNANGNISELGGTATIRIPYTLGVDEDPDNIIVWYISNGKPEGVPATYADGYVTFTTTHFSYYVATTVAPEQLCEYLKEHDMTNVHIVLPTCTEGGYSICNRCGKQIEGSETAPLGHEWHTTVISENDCTTNGKTKYECANCGFGYETIIAATGHYYVLKDQKTASCSESGFATNGCIYCDSEYTVTLPQLNHNYIVNVIAPTCEEKGYTEKTCLTCGDTLYTNYKDAIGHSYDAIWHATPAGHYHNCTICGKNDDIIAHTPGAAATEQSAQICTVCEYVITPQLSHTHNLTKVEATEVSCLDNGNIAYYTCECGKWFLDANGEQLITDHTSVIVLAKGHTSEALSYVEPTCTTVGYTAGIKCSVCDTVIRGHVELSAYGHNYITTETAPTCTQDGTISKTCASCGDKAPDEIISKLEHKYVVSSIKAPTCTEAGFTTYSCVYCKDTYTDAEKNALGHNYSTLWSVDEKEHWHECVRCGGKSDEADHIPGAEATETSAQLCTVCAFVIEPIKNHTHAPAQTIVAKAPTCESAGNIAYYICDCGEWYADEGCTNAISNHQSVIVVALKHSYVGEITAPTCEERGYTTYTCSREGCGKSYEGSYVAPLGHTIVTIPGTAATCTVAGITDGSNCSVCQKVLVAQEEIPATGHTEETLAAVDPTCTTNGLTAGTKCSVCNEILVAQEEISATGHTIMEAPGIGATCTTPGSTSSESCIVCREIIKPSEEIPATGHTVETLAAVDPTCTTTGLTEGTKCSVCNEILVAQEVIPTIAHTEETVPGTSASCTETGLTEGTKCAVCGVVLKAQEIIPENGHTVETLPGKDATCTETGLEEGKKCTVCDEVIVAQEVIPAIGHTDNDGDIKCDICDIIMCTKHEAVPVDAKAPTCTETGLTAGTKCDKCGVVLEAQETIPALGHTEETLPGKDATCTETGLTEGKQCTVCGVVTVEQNKTDPLGHKEVIISGKDATCTETGLTEGKQCTVCGVVTVEQSKTDPLGHTEETISGKAATCTETGLEEGKKCTVCGETTVEQKVIPATGHSYKDNTCEVCGAEKVLVDDYYINLVNSWKNIDGFTITIRDLFFEFKSTNSSAQPVVEELGRIKQLEIAELNLYIDNDGNVRGAARGSVELYGAPIDHGALKAVIDGEFIYMEFTYGTGDYSTVTRMKVATDYLIESMFGDPEDIDPNVTAIFEFLNDTIIPTIDTIIDMNSENVNATLENVFAILFNVQEQEDGTYVATLDYGKIHDLNENLATKTVADVIDLYFGEGAFDELVNYIIDEILNLKLSEIPAFAEKNGLNYKELVAQINDFCYKIGAPEDFDIDKTINSQDMVDVTIGMLIFDTDNVETYVSDFNKFYVNPLRDYSLYELFFTNEADDLMDMIDEIIDFLSGSISISFTTDSTGVLTSVDLGVNEFVFEYDYVEVNITVGISIEINKIIDVEWSGIVEEFEDSFVAPKDDMNKDEVDYDGKYGYMGTVTYNGQEYYYTDAYYVYAYKPLYDKIAYIIINPDCKGWTNYIIQYAQTSYSVIFATINVDGKEVMLLIDEYTGEYVEIEKLDASGEDSAKYILDLYFKVFEKSEGYTDYYGPDDNYYYYAETGAYADRSQHEYEYKHDLEEGKSCDDGYTLTTYCKSCDYKYNEHYYGHYSILQYTYKGQCGHEFSFYACPCGEYHHYEASGFSGTVENKPESKPEYDFNFGTTTGNTVIGSGTATVNPSYNGNAGFVGDMVGTNKPEGNGKYEVNSSETHTICSCDECGFLAQEIYVNSNEGCKSKNSYELIVKLGDVVLYKFKYINSYVHHDLFVEPTLDENGDLIITSSCKVCTEVFASSKINNAVAEENDGTYCYDVEFVPENSGQYTFVATATNAYLDVILYRVIDGEYERVHKNSASAISNSFRSTDYLEAGVTYVYRIRLHDGDMSSTIYYSVYASGDCKHQGDSQNISISNENGANISLNVCSECGCISGMNPSYNDYPGYDDPSYEHLEKMREEWLYQAEELWNSLPEMGVPESTLEEYWNEYCIIIEKMEKADDFETLQMYYENFQQLIDKVTGKVGEEITLEQLIKDVVNNAEKEWNYLLEMGVDPKYTERYEAQYFEYINQMYKVTTLEELESFAQKCAYIINDIKKSSGIEDKPKCPHDYVEPRYIEPTCTYPGYKGEYCYECEEYIYYEILDVLPHNFMDGKCTFCGAFETINPDVPYDCEQDGHIFDKDGKCMYCGYYGGGAGDGEEISLEQLIKDVVNNAENEWNSLLEMGVDPKYTERYKAQYFEYISQMYKVTTLEELESFAQKCAYIINDIKKSSGIEDKPECMHEHVVPEYKDATCLEPGYNREYCEDCGEYIFDEITSVLPHNFMDGQCTFCGAFETINPDVPYDCEQDGHIFDKDGKCMYCGYYGGGAGDGEEISLEQLIKDVVNNAENEWNSLLEMGVDPKYTERYKAQYFEYISQMYKVTTLEELESFAQKCAYIINDIKKSSGIEDKPECMHEHVVPEYKDATCLEPGYNREYCEDCGEYIFDEITSVLSHNFMDGQCTFCGAFETIKPDYPYNCNHEKFGYQVINKPTCTSDGYAVDLCYQCGMYVNEYSIPAVDHNFVDGMCQNCGAGGTVTEKFTVYVYETWELSFVLYSDGASEYKKHIYTEDGKEYWKSGENKWSISEDGKICVYIDDEEYLFIVNEYGELVLEDSLDEDQPNEPTPEEPPLSEFEYCRNEAINNAQEIWKQLPEMGVREEFIDKYQYQYRSIITEMNNADSMEALQDSVMMFQKMIEEIMQNVEGDPTPDYCNHYNVATKEGYPPTCEYDGYTGEEYCADCGTVIKNGEIIPALGHYFEDGMCVNCGMSNGETPDEPKPEEPEYEIRYIFDGEIYGVKIRYEFYVNGVVYAEGYDPETGEMATDMAYWNINAEAMVEIVEIVYDGVVVMQFTVNEDGYTLSFFGIPSYPDEPNPEEPDYPVESECPHINTRLEEDVLPTCVQDIVVNTYCEDCGQILAPTIIEACGHTFADGWKIKYEPTPDKRGKGVAFCETCANEIVLVVFYGENGEHCYCNHGKTFVKIAEESTCTSNGWGVEYCDQCDTVVNEYKILPLADHNWDYENAALTENRDVRIYCNNYKNCDASFSIPYEEWKGMIGGENTEGTLPEESIPEYVYPSEGDYGVVLPVIPMDKVESYDEYVNEYSYSTVG